MSENIRMMSIVVCEGNKNLYDEQREFSSLRRNGLRLKFLDNILGPVYTGRPIQGEHGTFKVALIDGDTGHVVKSCPEASAKLEIVVLDKNFNFTDDEDWNCEDFSSKIRVGEEGRSLLKGDPNPYVHLEEGVGSLSGVLFKHKREWFKKSKYRLGARILDQSNGARIREAKTKTFSVIDQRMMNKEHKLLVVKDHVWRLKGIGKDGPAHKLLHQENITTVKKFLTELHLNTERLQQILRARFFTKKWKGIKEHALTCKIDEKRYLYFSPRSERKDGVVFNKVGELMGVCREAKYVPVEEISASDKVCGQELVASAFKDRNNVKKFADHNSLMHYLSIPRSATDPSESGREDGSNEWIFHRSVMNENLGTGFTTSSQVAISVDHYMENATTSNNYSWDTIGNNSDQISSQSLSSLENILISPVNELEDQNCENWYEKAYSEDNLQSVPAASHDKVGRRWSKLYFVFKWLVFKKISSSEDAPMPKRRKFG